MGTDLISSGAKMEPQEKKIVNKVNKICLFCSITETGAASESIWEKLSSTKTEMIQLANSTEANTKNSMTLVALGPMSAIESRQASRSYARIPKNTNRASAQNSTRKGNKHVIYGYLRKII